MNGICPVVDKNYMRSELLSEYEKAEGCSPFWTAGRM
jgi:hypothetical protein